MAGQRNAENGGVIEAMERHERELREREQRLVADLQATRGALQLIEMLRQEATHE